MDQQNIHPHKTIWQNKIFMKLFASYSVSMLGHWFDMVAIIILFSYVWQASPLVIALIPVAYALPQVLLSQFAGVLTDQYHRVKIMLVSDSVTAVLTLLLFFTNSPWPALILLALRSAVNVVHSPAQQGLIKLVVDEKLIMKAVTLNGTVNQMSKIIGPFAGASLAGFLSPKFCILVNAAAFTISALILLTIVLNKKMIRETAMVQEKGEQKEGFWSSWLEGWKIVLKSRILFISLISIVIGFIAIQMIDIQFPVLFREIAPDLPELTGWLMGASGLGAVLMILVLNRFSTLNNYGILIGLSMLLIGTGFGGLGFLREGFFLLLPVFLGISAGLGVGLLSITFQYLIQKETTEKEIGRVSGIANSLISMTVLVSPLVGGMLVQHFGVAVICIACGGFLILFGLGLAAGSPFLEGKKKLTKEKAAAVE
ncbi:MFS transporter [Evansella clarkii]|uniref:MFS transporter n=1 Tax=Evansella clarkii TaxID=79879 RepID=UPI001430D766|nr:MFS transporter [Evansella clarkii]